MLCSCASVFRFFSAPPDVATVEYEISDFLYTYYCDFLNNVHV